MSRGSATEPIARAAGLPRALAPLLALIALGSGVTAARAVPAGGIAVPPPTRVERFEPDGQVCQPQTIRSSFNSRMQPWADQPEAVLAKLRQLQLEMTRATLQRCVNKGLMEPAQASQLERELNLQGAPAGPSTSGAPASAAPLPAKAH